MKVKASNNPQRRLAKTARDDLRSKTPVSSEGTHQLGYQPYHDDQAPVRASYESLVRSSESRQLLREQLTATFPETVSPTEPKTALPRWPSQDRLPRLNMGRNKDKKTLSSNSVVDEVPEPPSPTLSFHTARGRMSALPEKTIDVEAAISLLQELKKKASPEELVALHRALLPVKEIGDEHSRQVQSDQRKHFANRRRSSLLPGLATRGGPEDDPLRRYGESERRRPVSSRSHVDSNRVSVLSERPATPVDSSNGQAGVYRSGTLRITNGSASPASSIHLRDSFEIQDAKEVLILHPVVATHDYTLHKDDLDVDSIDDHSSTPTRASTEQAPAVECDAALGHPPPPQTVISAMHEYNEFCGSPYDRKVSSQSHNSASSGDDSVERPFVTPKASMADFAVDKNSEPPMPQLQIPSRPDFGHYDSGYGSEGSNKLSKREEAKTPIQSRPLQEQRWLTALPTLDSDAASSRHSLYTFDQVLKSPSIMGAAHSSPLPVKETSSPSSPQRPISRRQTLFSSLGLSRSQSTKALVDSTPSSSASTPTSSREPLTTPEKAKKAKSKKLKKAVPHHVREARKELKRFEQAAAAQAQVSTQNAKKSMTEQRVELSFDQDRNHVGVEEAFKFQAPQAYARIMAANAATLQQKVKEDAQHDQPRELQSSLSNAMSDDTDGTSVINFLAVARSLGTSPYDISTSQFKNSIDYIEGSDNKWRIQSPFEIGRGIPGPRTLGMDEQAASELARKKSKDYVESEMTTPRRPYGNNAHDPPPMPDMPQDIESKARRADQMVHRKLGDHQHMSAAKEPNTVHTGEDEDRVMEQKTLVPYQQDDNAVPAVDWTAQAKLWRERRQALQTEEPRVSESIGHRQEEEEDQQLDQQQKQPQREQPQSAPGIDQSQSRQHQEETARMSADNRPSHARMPIRRPVGSARPLSDVIKDQTQNIEIDRAASVSPAQLTLSNARAAIHERMNSPVSPLGRVKLEVGTRSGALSPVSDRSVSPMPSPVLQAPRGPRPPSGISLANTNGRFSADYLAKLNGSTAEAQNSTLRPLSASLSTPDRYSGGLQYEWQRGVGIIGSAGTQMNAPEGGARSMPSKVVYGLDLSELYDENHTSRDLLTQRQVMYQYFSPSNLDQHHEDHYST